MTSEEIAAIVKEAVTASGDTDTLFGDTGSFVAAFAAGAATRAVNAALVPPLSPPADRGTEALATAEDIIRNHDTFCVGHYEAESPWCSCAPDGTPLCESCRALADKITDALSASARVVREERDEAIQQRDVQSSRFAFWSETFAEIQCELDRRGGGEWGHLRYMVLGKMAAAIKEFKAYAVGQPSPSNWRRKAEQAESALTTLRAELAAIEKRAKALSIEDAVKHAQAGKSEMQDRLRWFEAIATLKIETIQLRAQLSEAQKALSNAQTIATASLGTVSMDPNVSRRALRQIRDLVPSPPVPGTAS